MTKQLERAGHSMKQALQDLAALGGHPLFPEPLYVGRPNVCHRDALMRRIAEATDRLWLSNDGPLLLEMEEAFARFLDVRHCIAVTNATIGLQLLMRELAPSGDVLMPSFTFIGTARAVEWQGARPVFCDVLPDRHTLDPAAVRAAMTPGVSAILAVHLWGRACEIDELQAIADEHGVPLFFDAAHAIGSTYKGRPIGSFGRAEVFSLHATKAINALEGGLITTNDDALAHRLRLARNYGIANEDVFEGTGINAKMNEFSAAMGLSNLEGFAMLANHNRALQKTYEKFIGDIQGVKLVTAGDTDATTAHYAVLEVDAVAGGLDRELLRRLLLAENVRCRRYFWPGCHRCPPFNDTNVSLPATTHLLDRVLQLPTGLQLGLDDAEAIGRFIAFAAQNASAIRAQLPATDGT